MLTPVNPYNASATATLLSGTGTLKGALLIAAAATATAVVRRGGSGGTVVCRLTAAANSTATFLPLFVVHGSDWHVTIAGAGAEFTAYF